MSRLVWKAKVGHGEDAYIEVPKGSVLLCAEVVDAEVWVWFLCEPNKVRYNRKVGWFVTDEHVPNGYIHIDSCISDVEPGTGVPHKDYAVHVFDGLSAH